MPPSCGAASNDVPNIFPPPRSLARVTPFFDPHMIAAC